MATPTVTQLSELDLGGSYTYADYLTWQFDESNVLFISQFRDQFTNVIWSVLTNAWLNTVIQIQTVIINNTLLLT